MLIPRKIDTHLKEIGQYFPVISLTGTPPGFFYPNYIASYLERDVKGFVNTSNLKTFMLFMESCAHFAGQLMNYDRLAQMVGVTKKTIVSWLGILEMSFIVFTIGPYFQNFGKRITKSPKLYFYDTGLLCHLLKLNSVEDVQKDRTFGALFENLVIADRMKSLQHTGERTSMNFFRDQHGLEADLFEGGSQNRIITEIKSSKTYSSHWDKNIRKIGALDKEVVADYRVIYGGDKRFEAGGTTYVPWFEAGLK